MNHESEFVNRAPNNEIMEDCEALSVDPESPDQDTIAKAAALIKKGPCGFPHEQLLRPWDKGT